jgi:tetratricopeptide (TPR) repeat protein
MICPNVSYAYQQKSMPYMKGGDYKNGIKYLNKAVEFDPERYTDYRAFMKCIFTKDYKGAIFDFNDAEKLDPNKFVMDHSYSFYRGLCNLELKNYKLAEIEFLKDIYTQTKNDTSITAHFNTYLYLGILYYEMKQFDKAKVFLCKSLLQYQNLPESNYYLSLTLEAQGKPNFKEFMVIAKNSKISGLTMNEDNLFYTNYPHQITLFEIEKKLNMMTN